MWLYVLYQRFFGDGQHIALLVNEVAHVLFARSSAIRSASKMVLRRARHQAVAISETAAAAAVALSELSRCALLK